VISPTKSPRLAQVLLLAGLSLGVLTYTHSAFAADPSTVPPTNGRLEYYGTNSGYLCKLSNSPVGIDKYTVALASVQMPGWDWPPNTWTSPQGAFIQGSDIYDGKHYSWYRSHQTSPYNIINVATQYICQVVTDGSPSQNCSVIPNSRNNSNECCPCGYSYNSVSSTCVLVPSKRATCSAPSLISPKNMGPQNLCPGLVAPATPATPHPINIGTGNKYLVETIYTGTGLFPLTSSRVYNSADVASPTHWRFPIIGRSISIGSGATTVTVARGDGKSFVFYQSGTGYITDADIADRLTRQVNGTGATTGWTYTNADDEVESYSATGQLITIADRHGLIQSLTRSDGTSGPNGGYVLDANGNPTTTLLPSGRLIRISDAFGRSLNFGWDGSSNLTKVTDPANQIYLNRFNTNNDLVSLTYPDGKVKQYLYNESAYTNGVNIPHALTGIIDENGGRYATYITTAWDVRSRKNWLQH
jgi:YD repeat-containing protein